MIYLGNLHAVGMARVVKAATKALKEEGEVGLFICKNGECAAYAHHHPEYARHLRVHHRELVGVYKTDPDCDTVPRTLYNQIDDDVTHHVLGQRAGRKAA